MKTWRKIEETKKRTGDITGLKKRNEEKVQKVSNYKFSVFLTYTFFRKFLIFNWIMNKRGK